jgi:YafQ family addiction module toxin component
MMPFAFDLSDHLRETLAKLSGKDPRRSKLIYKKIEEIIKNDEKSIDHYKNLRHDLSDYKRVHIDKSFVLIFKVDKKAGFILFERFDHHDEIYRR